MLAFNWNSIFWISSTFLLLQQISAANLSQLVKKQQQQQSNLQHAPQQQQQLHTATIQQQQQHAAQTQQQQQQHSNAQPQQSYAHENIASNVDELKHINSDEELNDPFQMLNDLKPEARLPPTSINYPWNAYNMHMQNSMPATSPYAAVNPYAAGNPYENYAAPPPPSLPTAPMPMPKFLPYIGYAQPVFIPFPLYIAPDMFYPAYGGGNTNELDDMVMSRAANGRRPGSAGAQRNSPIYYVRLPPTPYMFVPNMSPNPFGSGFSPLLTYQPMPTFSAFGSVFNLPVNFVANGKPSSVYQVGGGGGGASQDMHSTQFPNFNTRPPTPSNPYRPMPTNNAYLPQQQSYGLAAMPPPQQDSKMTSLKRPFVFNGRPDDIYILPNNFNPLYPENYY